MELEHVDIAMIHEMSRGSAKQRRLGPIVSRSELQFILVRASQDLPVLDPAGTLEVSEHHLLVATSQLQVICLHALGLRLSASRGLGLV